jgi:Protein of unknown function (DUF2867)
MPQISPNAFYAVPLRVHTLLADVPLHDVWAVDLPRVREGATRDQFHRLLSQLRLIGRLPAPARALFGLRFFLGRIFRLEDQPKRAGAASFAARLTPEDRARSSLAPGTPAGLFRVVYRFENEQLLEVHNRTVHGALLTALVETEAGYRFYLAVYVAKAGWITPVYMALIDPFRKWFIYPAMLKNIRATWVESHVTLVDSALVEPPC